MRGYAREVAFCKIYAFIMTGNYEEDYSQFEQDKLTKDDIAFADGIVKGVTEHREELEIIISDLSKSFKLSRIYRPDLAALLAALYEIKYTDTPKPVVINEIVGIVKKYSTEKSVSYVNGILAAYIRRTE